jgi:hypothetical protein
MYNTLDRTQNSQILIFDVKLTSAKIREIEIFSGSSKILRCSVCTVEHHLSLNYSIYSRVASLEATEVTTSYKLFK